MVYTDKSGVKRKKRNQKDIVSIIYNIIIIINELCVNFFILYINYNL
jgi:hypothetical protein